MTGSERSATGPPEEVGVVPHGAGGTVIVYAVFESSTGAGAWATRLRSATEARALAFGRLRHGRSRRHLELRALVEALDEAARLGWETVRVAMDDRRGAVWLDQLLHGTVRSRDPAAAQLLDTARRFQGVTVEAVPLLDEPALVRTAKLALDAVLARVDRTRRRRRSSIESVLERARAVTLEETPDGVRANGRYRVSLDPPRCDCPDWRRRWARVPLAGRRAVRLPCKHLAALAIREGIGTPADLERLVRTARG